LFQKIFNWASPGQSKPQLLESWNTCLQCCAQHWQLQNSSIFFVDDYITSGTTARLCYEALVQLGNHVDGLIWVRAGGWNVFKRGGHLRPRSIMKTLCKKAGVRYFRFHALRHFEA